MQTADFTLTTHGSTIKLFPFTRKAKDYSRKQADNLEGKSLVFPLSDKWEIICAMENAGYVVNY